MSHKNCISFKYWRTDKLWFFLAQKAGEPKTKTPQKFCLRVIKSVKRYIVIILSFLCETRERRAVSTSMWKRDAIVLRSRRWSKRVDQISAIFSSADQSRLLRRCCAAKQLTRISGGSFISPPTQQRKGQTQLFQPSIRRRRGALISRHFLSADLLSPHPFYFLPWPSISWKRNYSAIVSVGYQVTSTAIRFHQQFFPLGTILSFIWT